MLKGLLIMSLAVTPAAASTQTSPLSLLVTTGSPPLLGPALLGKNAWGDFNRMIGWWSCKGQQSAGDGEIVEYFWKEPGRVLVADHHKERAIETETITLSSAEGDFKIDERGLYTNAKGGQGIYTDSRKGRFTANGSFEQLTELVNGRRGEITRQPIGVDAYSVVHATSAQGVRVESNTSSCSRLPREVAATALEKLNARRVIAVETMIERRAAYVARREEAARQARQYEADSALQRERWEADMAILREEEEAESAAIDESNRRGTAERLANLGGSFVRENERLKKMGDDAIANGLARGTAEYNRRQAAAGRPVEVAEAAPVRSNAGAASGSSSSRPKAASTNVSADDGEALVRKSIQVYFSQGMQLVDVNGPNPMCYSNTFSVEIDYNPKKWGNGDRLEAAMAPMKSSFAAKCARLGNPVPGSPTYGASEIVSGWPRRTPHAVDYVVNMP